MKLFVLGGVTCPKDSAEYRDERARLQAACSAIGQTIASEQHTLVVCSPFPDTADVDVLKGIAESANASNTLVEYNFVDSPHVRQQLNEVTESLLLNNVVRIPHAPPIHEDQQSLRYAWLLCQLQALEACQVVIAIGGAPDGAANMLLQLADGKQKPVLPLSFLGGAAAQSFERRRYELKDRLGGQLSLLQDETSAGEVVKLATSLHSQNNKLRASGVQCPKPEFFISYSRARQAEADHVETLLRRWHMPVTRDESDFGAGHAIPVAIREAIYRCTIFVALWCREYACSPWCFDELELALDRHAKGDLDLWIFRLDDTRMVPTRARQLISHEAKSRQELDGRVTSLLSRIIRKGTN